MSTILEALRKSERARRARQSPVYGNASEPNQPSLLRWSTIIAGIALVAALAALVWLMQRQPPEIMVEAPSADTTESTANTAPAKTMPNDPPVTPAVMTPTPAPATAKPVVRTETPAPAIPAAPKPEPMRSPPVTSVPPGEVALWSSLPDSERTGMPPLRVNIHVYTPDEARRILYIDNEPRVRGEEVAPGVIVDEIVPEGAIVRYRGQRYLLPRPA